MNWQRGATISAQTYSALWSVRKARLSEHNRKVPYIMLESGTVRAYADSILRYY